METQESKVVFSGLHGEPLILKTPGVCGGDACIGSTRIPVWLLVAFKKDGAPDKEILEGYPTLQPKELQAAWDYYQQNLHEIEEAIRSNQEDEE